VRAVWRKPADQVTQIIYVPNDLRPVKAALPSPRLPPHRETRPAFSEPPPAQPEASQGQVMPGGFDTSASEIASARGFGGNGPVASDRLDTGAGVGRGFLPGGSGTSAGVFDGTGTQGNSTAPNPQHEPDEPAELLPGASPQYTPEAKRSGVTGEVWLEVELRSSGEVHVLRILSQPLGYGLEDVAVQAANRYRCKPAHKGGRAVTVVGQIKVIFTLSS